jgi:hypothetical protein
MLFLCCACGKKTLQRIAQPVGERPKKFIVFCCKKAACFATGGFVGLNYEKSKAFFLSNNERVSDAAALFFDGAGRKFILFSVACCCLNKACIGGS